MFWYIRYLQISAAHWKLIEWIAKMMGLGKCISVLKYVYLLCDVKFQGGVDHLQLYLTVDLRVGGHHICVYVMVPNLFMGFCLHIFPRNLGTLSSCEALAAGFKKIYSSILDPGFVLCCWIPGSCFVLSVVAKWHVKLLVFPCINYSFQVVDHFFGYALPLSVSQGKKDPSKRDLNRETLGNLREW